ELVDFLNGLDPITIRGELKASFGSSWIEGGELKFVNLTIQKTHESGFNLPIRLFDVKQGVYVINEDKAGLVSPGTSKNPGGIDFRNLPIVKKAVGNLKPAIGSTDINRLKSINLDREWQEIESLVSSGAIPKAERLKTYIQASCCNGDMNVDKVISCIADIMKIEEEGYLPTEPMLIDILITLESANSPQQLKAAFVGNI
ncbi:MAG: hypothetical protein PHW54_06060, partial [Candidatus Omnitrophica bacterium]|nr:hypothetical protein [Candidatus Omnitrophota bacterium]